MIYLGSNDLVSEELNSKLLGQGIYCTFLRYHALRPQIIFVWSYILPRLFWSSVPLARNKKIDQKRKNVNRRAAAVIAEVGGSIISHPDISIHNHNLFRHDGTNSEIAIFVQDLTQTLIKLI